MCGRFNLITDAQALIDFFELSSGVTVTPRYNISPSQNLLAVRQHDSRREALPLHWGLLPHWVKDRKTAFKMINARGDGGRETRIPQRTAPPPLSDSGQWFL